MNRITVIIFLMNASILLAAPPPWYKSQFNTGNPGNCGPASVAMMVQWANVAPIDPLGDAGAVARSYEISVEAVRAKIGNPYKDGATSMDNLEAALTEYDVDFRDVDYREINWRQIDALLTLGYKLIVLVDLDQIDSRANLGKGLGGHYFVISGAEGDYFQIQDPYNGPNVRFLKGTVTRAMTTTRFILVRQEYNWWERHGMQPVRYTPPRGICETK
jgi:Peptidase_C39 like family